ncbi:MAG: hypothetical protein M5R36_14570 [Deltaproteobacteria bacterium]|nr:hypothetical protein [Deltaproteobacteria bacterium]
MRLRDFGRHHFKIFGQHDRVCRFFIGRTVFVPRRAAHFECARRNGSPLDFRVVIIEVVVVYVIVIVVVICIVVVIGLIIVGVSAVIVIIPVVIRFPAPTNAPALRNRCSGRRAKDRALL